MKIRNIYQATEEFKRKIEKMGLEVVSIKSENFGRHRLITAREYASSPFTLRVIMKEWKFWLAYQREWFLSFAKYYDVVDVACTINLNILNKIIGLKIDKLVFCGGDGEILWIEPTKMMKEADKNKWIRATEKTKEIVVHYPLSWLKPVSLETLREKR